MKSYPHAYCPTASDYIRAMSKFMGRESRVKRDAPKTPKHPTVIDYAKPRNSVTLKRGDDVRAAIIRAQLEPKE